VSGSQTVVGSKWSQTDIAGAARMGLAKAYIAYIVHCAVLFDLRTNIDATNNNYDK